MKNILTLLCIFFGIISSKAQLLDTITDSTLVRPPITIFKMNLDTCFCKNEKSYVYKIIDTLKLIGKVYDLKTDDWYFEDTYMFTTFNKAFDTKVFSDIKCSKNIYFSTFHDNQEEDWIQIKEWIFKDNQNAKKAFNFINNSNFNSDYFGPRNWICLLSNNGIYFLCGASIDFWYTNKMFVKNIISEIILKSY